MAGLFELQLPTSRSRSSQDISARRLSSGNGMRSNSPPPEVAAREIVNQVMAKRDAAAASSPSSIFPWKRRTTTSQSSTRPSFDASPRNSADASSRSDFQSPERQRLLMSPRRVTAPVSPLPPPSPSVSTPINFTLTPSSPDPAGPSSKPSHSATVLAHAGLGLGLPPVAFPAQTSPVATPPISAPKSMTRKTFSRPDTMHMNEGAASSTLTFKVERIRRAKSFTKDERAQGVGGLSTPVTAGKPDKGRDVLFFTRDGASSVAPHVQSMPERSSRGIKGKGKSPASDTEITTPIMGNTEAPRWRQSTSTPGLALRDREQSLSRRSSWWPGRRRIDSSPIQPPPPSSPPPPIPQRSQARPGSSGQSIPSLPTFRPFSPLMSEFPITESPGASILSFEDRDRGTLKQRELNDAMLNFEEGGASVRRRHSLSNRTESTHSHVPSLSSRTSSRPSSQTHSHPQRYSWSMTLSPLERNPPAMQSTSSPTPPSLSSQIDTRNHKSKPQTLGSNTQPMRRRSMTVNTPPISPPHSPIHEMAPLLLRQPTTRLSPSGGPPDPFLTGWGLASGISSSDEIQYGTALSAPIEMERTPSTSSGSTSSHSPSVPATRSQRQRAGTTPLARPLTASSTSTSLPPPSSNLLRRLSSTLFSSTSTPVASTFENPRPALNSTVNLSSILHSGGVTSSPVTSNGSSPQWSREHLPASEGFEVMKSKMGRPPVRFPDETPEDYVLRLVQAVNKAEVAHVLAAKGDAFHAQALRCYIDRFNFRRDPLDVALRKLLMDLGLPRETQQIDRVMEAFAAQYVKCNPGIFADDDHPYILAFSLIMLHTDAFNKSNKNKMTKADYVRNARLPGVAPEVLECFFNNIVFAPFIFIEDAADTNGAKRHPSESVSRLNSANVPANNVTGTAGNSGGSTILGKANKIDPYYLITQGLLDPLRVDVDLHIPRSNPFLFEGTDWPWDTRRLHLIFAVAQVIHVPGDASISSTVQNNSISTPMRRKSIALPSLGSGSGQFVASPPLGTDGLVSSPPMTVARGPGSVRITKVGVLARKEDFLEGGRRATSRKWREWCVVLTGSQLLFFRDINFASQLSGLPSPDDASLETGLMKPDEAVSLQQCIALFDTTYLKYRNTFRYVMPTGRQFLCKASDEQNLNDWISTINYASAFRTAGVSMRGLGMSHKDVEMTGVAAAASHLQDLRISSNQSAPAAAPMYKQPAATRSFEVSLSRPQTSVLPGKVGSASKFLKSINGAHSRVDLESPIPDHLEGAQQLKTTFNEVKAELAALGRQRLSTANRVRTLSMGARPTLKTPPRPATSGSGSRSDDMHHSISRNDVLQSCIDTWDSKIGRMQHELDSELRNARNLALLTPFQRATRDRIQATVVQLAERVKNMRIELTKLICYRFVLLSDLADEERHLEQAKRDALKAATQRLSTQEGLTSSSAQKQMNGRPSRPTLHLRSSPSATQSFYSAVDQFDEPTPLSMLSEDDISNSPFAPVIRASSSIDSFTALTQSARDPTLSDTTPSPVDNGHEKFYTAIESPEEIAEEWHETRAAKRVSLVRLPSGVRLSSAFSSQPRNVVRDKGQPIASDRQERLPPSER